MSLGNSNNDGHDEDSRARLEALLRFPCRVHIKAVGAHSARFEALVHSLVGKHIAPADLLAASTRASRGGKYLAVTLTITAQSRAQLDDIYRDLSGCKDVLIAL